MPHAWARPNRLFQQSAAVALEAVTQIVADRGLGSIEHLEQGNFLDTDRVRDRNELRQLIVRAEPDNVVDANDRMTGAQSVA